jgi:asparagine N-glycosylation enzyme membrane subunit Stt3
MVSHGVFYSSFDECIICVLAGKAKRLNLSLNIINKKGGYVMLNTLKIVIAVLLMMVIILVLFNVLALGSQTQLFNYILIGLSLILTIIGVITAFTRHSKLSLGTINRAEFYGVIAFLFGCLMTIYVAMNGRLDIVNGRIDNIMLILMKLPK